MFEHFVDLYLGISTCFILEVFYKSLNDCIKLMTAIECVVSLFGIVSSAWCNSRRRSCLWVAQFVQC